MHAHTLDNGCHTPPALPHTRLRQPRQSRRTLGRNSQARDRSTGRQKDAQARRRRPKEPTRRRPLSPPGILEVPRCMPPRQTNHANGRTSPHSNARPRFRIRIRQAPRSPSSLRCRPLRPHRCRQHCTQKSPARRAPELVRPRTRSAWARSETRLPPCLWGLQNTLQAPP